MKNRVTTFDELVERARALEPTTLEVNAVLAHVSTSPPRTRRRLRRPSWRLTAAVLAVAVGAPATALAVSKLISPGQVANSLPAGAFLLRGTQPTCTTVAAGSVYRCTLAIRPHREPGQANWTGNNEPTVGADKRVSGACVAQNAPGTVWTCYVGQAAVDHKLILSKQQAYASQPWYVAHCVKRQADQTASEKRECAGVGLVYLGAYLSGPGVG
jgi:hypothetical protein